MRPISDEKSHCFKHAHTYPREEGACPYCKLAQDAPPAGQTGAAVTEHLLALKDDVFAKHTAAVSEFLNELYAIMVDPCAEVTMTVADMKAAIIKAALRDRDVAAQNAAKDEGRDNCLELLRAALAVMVDPGSHLRRRIEDYLAAQPVAAERLEPSVLGAGGGPAPIPDVRDHLDTLRSQIEMVADAAGLDPNEWLAAAQSDTVITNAMVDRFLSWPVPADVYPDGVAGKPGCKGTNLLTVVQAREMLEYALTARPKRAEGEEGE